MARKVNKALLTRAGGTMTEAQYLGWIRSALRAKSLKWPPRNEAIQRARRAYQGENKLQKWECQCAICKNWFKLKEIAVDHHPVAAGSIRSVADISQFVENLYCEVENLRVLCHPCHDIHTYAESNDISFEDAKFEKQVNEKMKDANLKEWLSFNGYSGESVSNVNKRKVIVRNILQGERNV